MRFLLPLSLLAACAEPIDSELSIDTAEIDGNWSTPNQSQIDRAVHVSSPRGDCSGARIAHRWVITAAHCKPRENDTFVYFFDSATTHSSRRATVVQVVLPPGIPGDDEDCGDPGNCDDLEGNHADMALLRIAASDDEKMAGPNAVLEWDFPGQVHGWQVGNGSHEERSNLSFSLRRAWGEIDDDTDSDGSFTTVDDQADHGDSGGPFYVSGKIVGVLTGQIPILDYNLYTAVPHRLDWILDTIGYRWLGGVPRLEHKYGGTVIDSLLGKSVKECQYACENTASCEAYNYNNDSPSQCQLVDNATTTISDSNWRGALKHAGATGVAANTAGYVRADNRNVVVHVRNGLVRELAQITAEPYWQSWQLPIGPETPSDKLSAYRRSDGIDAVVYRSGTAIIELAQTPDGWQRSGLPTQGTVAGNPVGFVRADGENAVVYRTTDGHVREMHLASQGQWRHRDLTTTTTAPDTSSDVSAFRRSDGYTSVVFRSGTDIWELYKQPGDVWRKGNLSSLTTNGWAPAAASRPHGFKHSDGYNAVVYRATNDRVVELWLDSSGWHWGYLSTALTYQDPTGYVRSDGMESVVTRNRSYQVVEIALSGTSSEPWIAYNLPATGGQALSSPMPYVRNDGFNSVVYRDSSSRVIELAWRKGMTAWSVYNLSATANE